MVSGTSLNIPLHLRAYGVFVQNLTAQWVQIAEAGFVPPNTSGSMALGGTTTAVAKFAAPPGVVQPAAAANQTCFLTYVETELPFVAGPTQGSSLASVAQLERFARAALPAVGNKGRLVELTDYDQGLWIDDGTLWHSINGEVFDARASDVPNDGTTSANAAITLAFNAMTGSSVGGGLLYFPPGSYLLTTAMIVPNKVFIVCHPLAEFVCQAPVQFGSKTVQFWQTGGRIRVKAGGGGFTGALVECYNLLGDSSLDSDQIQVTLSATGLSNDIIHIHSTNAAGGAADVRYFISGANFVGGPIGILMQCGDDAGGAASLAGDFVNGNTIRGSFATNNRGIRLRGTGPVGGSVAGTGMSRNYFERIDCNSYDTLGLDVFDALASNNIFNDCTWEGTAGSTDINSSLGGGQIFIKQALKHAKSASSFAARDKWFWDEANQPIDDFGLDEITARYMKVKNRMNITGFAIFTTASLTNVAARNGTGGRNTAQGEFDICIYGELSNDTIADGVALVLYRSTVGVPVPGGAPDGTDVIVFQTNAIVEGTAALRVPVGVAHIMDAGLGTSTLFYYYLAIRAITGGNASIENARLVVDGGN